MLGKDALYFHISFTFTLFLVLICISTLYAIGTPDIDILYQQKSLNILHPVFYIALWLIVIITLKKVLGMIGPNGIRYLILYSVLLFSLVGIAILGGELIFMIQYFYIYNFISGLSAKITVSWWIRKERKKYRLSLFKKEKESSTEKENALED